MSVLRVSFARPDPSPSPSPAPIDEPVGVVAGRRGRIGRRIAAGAALFLLSALSFLLYIGLFWGNIRTVVPGRLYRSAQLPPEKLSGLLQEHGIRTVISLKGGDLSRPWFRKQSDVCTQHGATLQAVKLRATALPEPDQLKRLIRLLDGAEQPVLLHCQGGADRTGLATTLYLHLKEGLPLEQAQARGLTWHYGHFPFEAKPMDRFFELYREHGEGKPLREWIFRGYSRVLAQERGR